jgi:hypothetical protein
MTRNLLTRSDLAELEHVAGKRSSSDRVGRCHAHGGFLWRGAARRPACPVCGDGLASTTSSLGSGFHVLTDEVLDVAERLPGGIREAATWHRDNAARLEQRAAGDLARAELVDVVEEPRPYSTERPGDRIARRGGSSINLDGLLRSAAAEYAKAGKLARRLERLGGPLERDLAGMGSSDGVGL